MTETHTPGLHPDTTFKLLTDRYRRWLLVSLLEHESASSGTPLPIHEFVDDPATELQLVHVHLPMLDAAGVVEWARTRRELAPGPAFDELEPLLELLDENAHRLPGGWP